MAKSAIRLNTEGFDKAIKQIGKFRLDKIKEIKQELDRVTIAVESGAKINLTTGGQVDTGRLRSSIVRHATGEFSRTVGSNVEYAAAVEFGFDGEVSVSSHTRKNYDKEEISGPRASKEKWVKVQRSTSQVSTHTRHMKLKARPYLYPALEAQRGKFLANIKEILNTK
ncbi:HK97 gp10 family phage protein [Nibribacter koreensis]|uniref:Phage protein, HK97 gp10 family n=1 Tax=Nibribacter koreensis TaxID=1084519 RepID=A0ABP8FBF9_9BACT